MGLMRKRDPHDDPTARRRLCHHRAVVDADRWPDDTVLLDLDRRAVCTSCGMIGADVRPNWNERPPAESLTGAQWRAAI
jgi:hypothetical protein